MALGERVIHPPQLVSVPTDLSFASSIKDGQQILKAQHRHLAFPTGKA